jgi:anti-sigma B factor antagonist
LRFDPRDSGYDPGALAFENLRVNEQTLGDGHLIDACGEIDHMTTPLVADALRKATLDGYGPVVLDLTETTFIDSAGISTLLNGLRRLTRLRRKLIVICPPGPARRVFDILGLVGTFQIVDSLREVAR